MYRSKPDPSRPVGSMFDLGELLISPDYPNAMLTTWDSPNTPPSGFFSYIIGNLNFTIEYINPPVFGHEAIYYYQNKPYEVVGIDAGNLYEDNIEIRNIQNTLKSIYAEANYGLGGFGVESFNIGNFYRGASEYATLTMRSPTPVQKDILTDNPDYFPNKFWDGIDSYYN